MVQAPNSPRQNYKINRRRLGRPLVKEGDWIYFRHRNGKEGVGEVISASGVKIFGPSKHWKVRNMNSGAQVIVPEDRINSVVNIRN